MSSYSFFEKPDKLKWIGDQLQTEVVNRLAALDKFKNTEETKEALRLCEDLSELYHTENSKQFRGKPVSTVSETGEERTADEGDHTMPSISQ